MSHPRVRQLRFARSEWLRGLDGVSDEDGARRFLPMNSIGWIVGHLAWHEQLYWLARAQGKTVAPELEAVAYTKAASTPRLSEMWSAWRRVTAAADAYLDTLTTDTLLTHLEVDGRPHEQTVGTMLQRVTYHYWYHLGESQAVRQLLGHASLPDFVGDIQREAPYRAESEA